MTTPMTTPKDIIEKIAIDGMRASDSEALDMMRERLRLLRKLRADEMQSASSWMNSVRRRDAEIEDLREQIEEEEGA